MLEVRVGGDMIAYVVNGTVVHTTPKSAAKTDGVAGFRVNHVTEVMVDDFGRRCSSDMVLLLIAGAVALVQAEDWPQFRGPTGQGHATERGLPLEWSESKNIVWRKPPVRDWVGRRPRSQGVACG